MAHDETENRPDPPADGGGAEDQADGGDSASEGDASAAADGGHSDERASSGSDAGVSCHLRRLKSLLRATRRRRRRAQLVEGGAWYAAALGAVFATAILGAALSPSAATPPLARWIVYIGGGAATLGAGAALYGFVGQSSGLEGTARALERAERSFRSDIVAALEFGEEIAARPDADDRQLGFSRALARAHLERTVDRLLERADGREHLADLLPDRPLEPPLVAVAGCLLLILGSYWIAPSTTVRALTAPALGGTVGEQTSEPTTRPVVSDLRLRYSPPTYTGEKQRTEVGSTGQIEGVAGSEVTLDAAPLFPEADTEIVLETGGDERVVPMKPMRDGRRVGADLVLSENGSYHFRAVLPGGRTIEEGTERSIQTRTDQKPEVQITSHSGTIEVSPNDVLEIAFEARDDFGLTRTFRVHHLAGNESNRERSRVEIPELENKPSSVEGETEFDLRPLSLKPKDRVVFQVEARDNNTRTGPGVGTSDSLVLKVTSPEDEHMEVLEAERELADKLLGLLADYLEHPMGRRVPRGEAAYAQEIQKQTSPGELASRLKKLQSIHAHEGRLLERMASLLERMKGDPLMSERNLSLFEGMYEQLRSLHARGDDLFDELAGDDWDVDRLEQPDAQRAADFTAEVEGTLERGLLRLLELVATQKMEAIESTRADIRDLQKKLERLLQKYKETKDPKLKEKIQRKIARLRQRMTEMMTRMQMQVEKLPERHLNEEALEKKKLQSDSREMADSLDSLQKRLEEDDVDGAMEALKNLDQRLSSLGKEMEDQFSGAQPKGLSKLDKEVSKLMNQVNDLRNQESALEEKTRSLQKEAAREQKERVREMLDEKLGRLGRRVDRQVEDLGAVGEQPLPNHPHYGLEENRQSLQTLKDALDQRDVQRALEAAESSLEDLESLRFNLGLAGRQSDSETPEGRHVDEATERVEGEMVPRARSIEDALRQLQERAESMEKGRESEKLRELAERQRQIDERAGELQKKIEESSDEFPMLEKKLSPSLEKARQEMGRAGERLGSGKSRGALDSERAALKQLRTLKRSMKQTLKKKRSQREGGRRRRRDDVEIPDQDQGPSREALREEVMKAMDGEKVEGYEDAIEQYYKNIVK